MSDTKFFLLRDQDPEAGLRAQLAALRARYDGAMPPYIFAIVRMIETQLSWHEHQQVRP